MLQNLFPLRQFTLTKWIFFVHSTMPNAPYVQPRLDLILELCRTFWIGFIYDLTFCEHVSNALMSLCICIGPLEHIV